MDEVMELNLTKFIKLTTCVVCRDVPERKACMLNCMHFVCLPSEDADPPCLLKLQDDGTDFFTCPLCQVSTHYEALLSTATYARELAKLCIQMMDFNPKYLHCDSCRGCVTESSERFYVCDTCKSRKYFCSKRMCSIRHIQEHREEGSARHVIKQFSKKKHKWDKLWELCKEKRQTFWRDYPMTPPRNTAEGMATLDESPETKEDAPMVDAETSQSKKDKGKKGSKKAKMGDLESSFCELQDETPDEDEAGNEDAGGRIAKMDVFDETVSFEKETDCSLKCEFNGTNSSADLLEAIPEQDEAEWIAPSTGCLEVETSEAAEDPNTGNDNHDVDVANGGKVEAQIARGQGSSLGTIAMQEAEDALKAKKAKALAKLRDLNSKIEHVKYIYSLTRNNVEELEEQKWFLEHVSNRLRFNIRAFFRCGSSAEWRNNIQKYLAKVDSRLQFETDNLQQCVAYLHHALIQKRMLRMDWQPMMTLLDTITPTFSVAAFTKLIHGEQEPLTWLTSARYLLWNPDIKSISMRVLPVGFATPNPRIFKETYFSRLIDTTTKRKSIFEILNPIKISTENCINLEVKNPIISRDVKKKSFPVSSSDGIKYKLCELQMPYFTIGLDEPGIGLVQLDAFSYVQSQRDGLYYIVADIEANIRHVQRLSTWPCGRGMWWDGESLLYVARVHTRKLTVVCFELHKNSSMFVEESELEFKDDVTLCYNDTIAVVASRLYVCFSAKTCRNPVHSRSPIVSRPDLCFYCLYSFRKDTVKYVTDAYMCLDELCSQELDSPARLFADPAIIGTSDQLDKKTVLFLDKGNKVKNMVLVMQIEQQWYFRWIKIKFSLNDSETIEDLWSDPDPEGNCFLRVRNNAGSTKILRFRI